jgi:hypothetical protein
MRHFLLFILLFLSTYLSATHIVGGSIHYRCLGFGQYEVKLIQYRDCSGVQPLPFANITYQSISCGQFNLTANLPLISVNNVTPICGALTNATTCNGGTFPGVQEYVYSDTLTMPANCNDWVFSYPDCCWNNSVVNIVPSSDFYIYSNLNDLDYFCNSNVTFNGRGIVFANLGQSNVYLPLGADADGDQLKYRLTAALSIQNTPLVYTGGFNPLNPISGFQSFDTLSGAIMFTPTIQGNFVIAFNVEEYRNGVRIATTHRVVQVIVRNFGNSAPPVQSVNNVVGGSSVADSIFACTGTPINFDFTFTDSTATDSIGVIQNIAGQLPGAIVNISGTNPLVINVQWTPTQAGIFNVSAVVENLGCPFALNSQLAALKIFVSDQFPRLTASDIYLCSNPIISIFASSGFSSYLWSTGATTQAIFVNTPGVYSVTTTGGNCGGNSSSIQIFQNRSIFIGNDTTIYLGDSIQLMTFFTNGLTPGLFKDTAVSVTIPLQGIAEVNLNVNGVFPSVMDTFVLENTIIDLLSPSGTDSLDIFLVAPNTRMIPLARKRGGQLNTTYTQSVFDPFATDPISNYANTVIPVDSTFRPDGNWNNLFGSNVNGTWKLAMRQLRASQTGLVNYFGLQFGGRYNYNWSPSAGLSCTDCPNPIASPDSTTTYILELSNTFGCVSYDTITIYVRPNWNVDTLRFLVTEDSTLNFCLPVQNNFGTLISTQSVTQPLFGILQTSASPFCFEYIASQNSENTDSIIITACNQQGFCDTTIVYITTISCVWPGDANDDNIVNNNDILPIGLGYGQTGTLRPNASLSYICQPHKNWGISTPVSNIDYKHSDTDGNSIIDDNDTLAIVQNWGLVHLRPNPIESNFLANPAGLYIDYATTYPGSLIRLPILLGDVNNPQDSTYGLAFTIFYDNTMVEPGSVFVDFDSSWIGSVGTDMIAVAKDFHNNGQIQVGLSRTNQIATNGHGRIGTLQLIIKNNLNIVGAYQRLIMGIGQVTFIDNFENNVSINPVPTYVTVLSNITSVNNTEEEKLNVYPNPATEILHINSSNEVDRVKIYNTTGQVVISKEVNLYNFEINVSDLAEGIYVLETITDNTTLQKKIVIKKS